MTILRSDLDTGRIDIGDIDASERMPPVTPGELLREFLDELGLSANKLARDIDVPPNRILAILEGTRAITADTALRLAHFFGTSPQLWLNLQMQHDLDVADRQRGAEIRARVRPALRPEQPK